MEQYIEDFIVYKSFGEMPNEGGTGEQPYEWVEAMMAIQMALSRVENEEQQEMEQREQQKQKQQNASGKNRFVG